MSLLAPVRHGAATLGGSLPATAARATSAIRPAAKPLHPRGGVRRACLHRTGVDPAIGVEFLDAAGIAEGDADISFDPVLNRLPGLDQYGWVERLREPAYDEARADRGRG